MNQTYSRFDYALSFLVGAIGAVMMLMMARFGVELWAPSTHVFTGLFRGLTLSALVGAVSTIWSARTHRPALAATACALAWGMWSLMLHSPHEPLLLAKSVYGMPADRERNEWLTNIFFLNGLWHPLVIVGGLMLAEFVSRAMGRQMFDISTPANQQENVINFPSSATLRRAAGFVGVATLLGFVLLSLLSLLLTSSEKLAAADLPSPLMLALPCAAICVLTFAIATFIGRRIFPTCDSISYLLVAPIVVAGVSWLMWQTDGRLPIALPAARLLWQSSPFEATCWGTLGAAMGYTFGDKTTP
jgi:hypothetical protein